MRMFHNLRKMTTRKDKSSGIIEKDNSKEKTE